MMNETLDTYTLKNAAAVLGVSCADDAVFQRVRTDSRTLQAGDLFVALKGPNFDGHDHVEQAQHKGAVGAVVSTKQDIEFAQLEVKDTRLALAQLAKARRAAFKGKVVGLTGSNGKTTVKEMIAAILRESGKVLATKGNLNNDIGVPLTLLELEGDEAFAVIEMGANHPGEIAFLTDTTKPDVALITNAGAAHLEGFGSIEGVARAKGEIYSGLTKNGKAIVNLDDKYSGYWESIVTAYEIIGFALENKEALITASNIREIDGINHFTIKTPNGECEVSLNFPGEHNVQNALAATSIAYALNVDLDKVKIGLQSLLPVKGRLNFIAGRNGCLVIDDTYNANRDSMKAAIDVLAKESRRKIAVLGDLFESGENANELHAEIGVYAHEKGIDEFYGLGELSKNATDAFNASNNALNGEGKHFLDKDQLTQQLQQKLDENIAILIKGSRGMRMEEVVEKLIGGA